MVESMEMAERHGRMLARFQALGADLAELYHDGAMAAETPEAAERQGRAFNRACRCARQSMALEARFFRDLARQEREALLDAQRQRGEELARRKKLARMGVERLIWTEAEGAEAVDLGMRLDDLLDEDELSGVLAEGAIEAHIARLGKDLGLGAKAAQPAPIPKAPAKTPRKRARRKPAREPDVLPFSNLHDDPWKDWRAGYDPPDAPPEEELPPSG